jgi:hypothetical protein
LDRACPASARATAVDFPLTPLAKGWQVAEARTSPDLLCRAEFADRSALVWHLRDDAVALPLAAAFVASAPVMPLVPIAVLRLRRTCAWLHNAPPRLLKSAEANLATVFRLDCHLARTLGDATSARHRALTLPGWRCPLAPFAELAIHRRCRPFSVAWVASLDFLRCTLAERALALALALAIRGSGMHAAVFSDRTRPRARRAKRARRRRLTNAFSSSLILIRSLRSWQGRVLQWSCARQEHRDWRATKRSRHLGSSCVSSSLLSRDGGFLCAPP